MKLQYKINLQAKILQQQLDYNEDNETDEEKEKNKFNNRERLLRQTSKTTEKLPQRQHRVSQQQLKSEDESIIIPQKVPLGFGSSSER